MEGQKYCPEKYFILGVSLQAEMIAQKWNPHKKLVTFNLEIAVQEIAAIALMHELARTLYKKKMWSLETFQ